MEYEKSKKGKYYNQFENAPKWKAFSKALKKQIWSAFIQLKLGHGYFRSYLVRFLDYSSNRCFTCGTKENPEHLILHCKNTKYVREELKKEFDIKEFSLKNLFNTNNSKSLSWNLGSSIEVFNAELFVIEKAFKIAFEKITKFTKNIWIFSNSQAAI